MTWKYTGHMVDHGTPSETCELCGMTNLRYHFEIRKDRDTKMVGSECIKRFGYEGYERANADRRRAIRLRGVRPTQETSWDDAGWEHEFQELLEEYLRYRTPRDIWDEIQEEEWDQPEEADDPEDNDLIVLAREKS